MQTSGSRGCSHGLKPTLCHSPAQSYILPFAMDSSYLANVADVFQGVPVHDDHVGPV
jgi:hypothetical protein